jgi:chromosome segregation ATPase
MTVADTAAALAKTGLSEAQKIAILMSKGLSAEEAKAALATASHTAATVGATGATAGLTGATLSLKTALNGLKVAFMTNPLTAIITIALTLIPIIISIANAVKDAHKSVSEKLEDLNSQFTELSNKIKQVSSDFQSLKSNADSVIPRFTELAQGVNQFGENVSLTDEEYEEFLRLNNQIAEMFPELNLGMDSNGNAMLALSYSADTLTNSLYNLVEAERQAAHAEIAGTMPDVIENIKDTVEVYKDEIEDLKDSKEDWEDVYNDILNQSLPTNVGRYSTQEAGYQAALDFIEKAQHLGMHGNVLMDNQQSTNNGYVFSVQWDYENVNLDYVDKLYAAKQEEFDKQIHDYERRIQAKWQTINPVVGSWLQTDFLFNDLDKNMQLVAETMVSGLDFSSLGLTTQEEVQNYITNNILNPLFLAAPEVRNAFASITDWREQLQKGEITSEQFSKNVKDTFNNLVNGMDASQIDTFKSAFVAGFNAIGIEGDNFDAVVDNIIASWGSTNSVFNKTDGIDDAISKVQTLTSSISAVQEVLSGQGTGVSLSVEDFNSAELKDYTSALEYNNGALQLNADKVNELIKAKTEEQIAINDTNKAVAQSKYLENAAEIERLRRELGELDESETSARDAIQGNINTLLEENSVLKDTCTQYDLMSSSLREATSAYQHWLNAQSAAQSGDMFDDTVDAFNHINDTLNNKDSDLYGRVGRTDYEAAVNLVIPDSIDPEDSEAVNKYMKEIYSLFTYDDDGNYAGLNIKNFCERAVGEGLMVLDEATNSYQIVGQQTMEDFAEGMNLSLPLVQAMFGEMEEFGAEFSWADEAHQSFGDLAVSANEAAEALRGFEGNEDLKIRLDVSDIESGQEKLDTLDLTIAEMNTIKAKPNVDPSEVEYANEVIKYCVAQKQLLSQPDVMMVDTSVVEGDLGNAIALLQEFQTAKNNLEVAQALGIDTTQAQADLDAAAQKIQNLDANITSEKALNIDTTSIDTITTSISNLSAELIVKAGVDETAVIGYQAAEHDAQGTVIWDNDTKLVDVYAEAAHYAEGTVTWYNNTNLVKTKFYANGYVNWNQVNGTAHASGTARAGGDWGTAPGGKTLVGELGQEIVVDPHTGRWYTVGDTGAEFRDIPRGAIVFNHKQSESLLKNGYVAGRASALVGGTAMVTGGIPVSGADASTESGGNKTSNYTKGSSSNSHDTEDELEVFDWIEVAIDRIERAVDRLKTTATSAYKALKTKLGATYDEISKVNEEIAVQGLAYERYMEEANSVGLSSDLASKVQDGTIDLTEYDSETQELIKDYQEWYEKALDCSDAIQQLHEDLASLYEDNFNNIKDDFDSQLELLEHMTTTYETGIDKLEAQGYLQSTEYYAALKDVEQQNIDVLNQELASLIHSFSEAMASGEIEEGSEAWYNMQIAINDVKEQIDEAELSLAEYAQTMREIEWEHFDYTRERIAQLTQESDFMIELMSNSDMHTDNGQLTDEGMATMGLHGLNYNTYMAEADAYAQEILEIDKQLAEDPYNTELIERREELLGLQQDSILAAEAEKQAIIDLVREGIELELASLKELIDGYTDALDSAKDLYEYQKKIKEHTQEIASIQKQLSAYENDYSEETQAKVQQLRVQLEEAESNLEETEYTQYIADQKKLLDELYLEYETVLNERLDNTEALLEEMIGAVNENSGSINTTLTEVADSVGYTMTESMQSIWNGSTEALDGIISTYGDDFGEKMTAANNVLSQIEANTAAMIANSDEQAEETVEDTTPTTDPDPDVTAPTTPTEPEPSTPSEPAPQEKTITVGGKINAKGAKIYDYAGDKSGENQYFSKDPIYTVLDEKSGYLKVRHHKLSSGVTGWFKKSDVKAYKTGGLVDYTGLAQLDGTPGKPELVLNAQDTANFIALKETLQRMSEQGLSFGTSYGSAYVQSLSGITDISKKIASIRDTSGINTGVNIGDTQITIEIDHVEDYNDFVAQLQKDKQFERFVQSMTVDRLVGGTSLKKNKYFGNR